MKNKKLADILYFIGVVLIILGILLGCAVGFFFGGGGFELVPSITVWLLSIIIGTGLISISDSLFEAEEKKADDEEFIKLIIENVKNEDNKDKNEENTACKDEES